MSSVQQYASVEVRSWDPTTKKNIVAEAKSSEYSFDGTTGSSATGDALYGSTSAGCKYVVTDQPVNSKDEAQALAQSLFDQFSMDYLVGEVVMKGEPKAVPVATSSVAST
jgi:phage protein D